MKINITQKEKVIQVSGGSTHTMILTQKGNVYCMGSNSDGISGLGNDYNNRIIPSLIDSKHFNHEKIIQICAGSYHSMALTQEGNVYSWGYNYYGQLGHANKTNENVPMKIDSIHFNNEKLKSIITGECFSFALTKNNKLYAWGDNEFGQLGLNHNKRQYRPSLIDSNTYNNEKIIKVSCGYNHTLLLTQKPSSTNLYACGHNLYSQLGFSHGEDENTFKLFKTSRLILIDFKQALFLQQISFGKIKDMNTGCDFSMVITEQNGWDELYAWGNNTDGQLGLNDEYERNMPQKIHFSCSKNSLVKKIGNGSRYCFTIIKERGCKKSKVYTWGFNTRFQLGLGHCDRVLKPTLMKCFESQEIISIGGNFGGSWSHSFAISKTGKLFTWGRNEFGQLGLSHCKNVNEPQLCCPELFGVEKTNEKMYMNESFEDVSIEFC